MLKTIPNILSPELLKIIMEMGHGDEIVFGDGNFPAASVARNAGATLLRYDGHTVPELLDAVMKLFPLDQYCPEPAFLMEIAPQDQDKIPPPKRWSEYQNIIRCHEPDFQQFKMLERFAFYRQAQFAYAIVATSDEAIYANIILKKGIL